MTAATMDSFDAQMADYQNDFDVPMHISSSDNWLQDVAPMEDDAQLAFQSKVGAADASPTIEVDMEAYIDDGHVEYDMVDDHLGHNPASGELLDVDVLPASTMQSPFVAVTTLPPVEYPPHSVSTPHSISTPLLSEQVIEPARIIEPKLVDHNTTSDLRDNAPLLEVEQRSDRISTPEAVALHEYQNTEHITIPTTSSEVPLDETDILHATNPTMLRFHPETNEISPHDLLAASEKEHRSGLSHLRSEQEATGPETTSNSNIQAPHDPLTLSHVLLEQDHERITGVPDPEPYVDDAGPFIVQDPLSKPTPLEVAGEAPAEERPPSPQEKEVSVLPSIEESAEVSNEPPEETYLEAPPPILLAIFSNDQPELCLFNKPSEPLPNEDDSQERHILLQASPNLYYEPLVHVFEALRQDEYISTVLEVSGNELALEAYDLELAITEDNFYAREISLHDFHFLHTSANIAGSLRLRLYISGPRFFARYHALQGLLNLHLDDSKDVGHGETEKPLDEHDDRVLYAREDASVAENASSLERRPLGSSKEEEGVHEHVDGYHEASHTVSEATATEPGEIDLSTLPPFIDSPEAHEEDADQQGEYSGEAPYHTTTTPDNASIGDNYTQDDEQRSEEQETEEEENSEKENDKQEHEEQENEERENDEEQESYHSLHTEEPDSTEVKPAVTIPVDTVQTEENGAFEENVADGLETSNIVEGAEEQDSSTITPQEHTENLRQPEQNEGDQFEYISVELTDKIQRQEGDNEDIPFEVPVDAYQEAEATANVKDVEGLDEAWDDELDGEGDPDTTWDAEPENLDESISNESSVTLSSKASKRSFNESGLEHSDDENCSSESPGAKRVRMV